MDDMENKELVNDDVTTNKLAKYRRWFRAAVDNMSSWRDEAQEDYDFVAGKQWSQTEKAAFESQGRPALTINRIKPLINVLSGYQRLNRYDIDFLPRTNDDGDLCKVRKGLTKYVLDRCDYNSQESAVFLDSSICGLGWFSVGYKFDAEINDGEAIVQREDPFGIYVDPEAHKIDYSDAKYICRAKWCDKEELMNVYPEKAEEIKAQCNLYDKAERHSTSEIDPMWYQQEMKKVRLVECWYKVHEKKTMYYLTDGSMVPQEDMAIEYFLNGMIQGMRTIQVQNVRVCVFVDQILLEDIPSPYEHKELPFVPLVCYYYGTEDIPAGFVRDLKDPQREINKRRIQTLHILNTTGNGGGFIEDGAMTPAQEADFIKHGNVPGHCAKLKPGGLNKVRERMVTNPPAAIIQAEGQATADLTAISGINEALMGVGIPSESSGRAIELKQRQAITHIAPMFDALRKAKKQIAYLLWGTRGHKGVIPQYYTDEKAYRIEGENGQSFVTINKDVIQRDPLGNIIHSTLNNISEGDFDIIISDVEASTTQRQQQMYSLIDSVKNLGVPGDMVFDIILDLSDLPNKAEIKQRWAERQKSMQQQAQAQQQLEMIKNQNMNQSIAFKDAPLPIQMAMAAKQGLVDPQIAQYAVNVMVEQMFPQLAQQMNQQKEAQEQQQAVLQAQQQLQAQGMQPQQQQLQ